MSRAALYDDYARVAARKSRYSLDSTALRTRSRAVVDLFAHLATAGRLTFRDVQKCLAEARHAPRRTAASDLEPLDLDWAARLARVVALQGVAESDHLDALAIYRHLEGTRGPGSLERRHAELYAHLLYEHGEYGYLRHLLPQLDLESTQRAAFEADLLNPFRRGLTGSCLEEAWLAKFQAVMGTPPGDERLVLRDNEGGTPFDRLTTTSPPITEDGPLISVVMPIYQPDTGLGTAVGSILQQSWRNLEILLVDDGSSSAGRQIFDEIADLDPRIRPIRRPSNGGAYRTRNTGLTFARGEFITVQDGDDWSHPDRLLRQVEPLLADPSLVATRSTCVRVTDDLVFSTIGYRPRIENASSLLFRQHPVVTELGYFDEVRKGADNEYYWRLHARFGRSAVLELDNQALAIVRRTVGSLSRNEFRPGWRHRGRAAYRMSYDRWHAEIRAGASAFLPREPDNRPFPAPRSFLQRASDLTAEHYDVVFVGDWRADGGPQRSMLEEIRALIARDVRVGVAHLEALRFMTRRDDALCAPVLDLIHQGAVDLLQLDEPAQIDLLLIRYPPILQFPPEDRSVWQVAATWIIANQAPSERDGSDLRYLVPDCSTQARRLFGPEPTWVPQGPTVRAALEPLLPPGQLAPFDNPGILRPEDWFVDRCPSNHPQPRVGRYSRDNAMKYPQNRDELLATYGDRDISLTMMGAAKRVRELLGDLPTPSNWRLLQQGAVPVKEFLAETDFFVYFDHPVSREAFGRSVLEALASGCVVVLPRHFEAVFGEAAIYTNGSDAMSVVKQLHGDPGAFADQVAVAQRVIRERFSHEAFVKRLTDVVPALSAPQSKSRSGNGRAAEVTAGRQSPPPSNIAPSADVASAHPFVLTDRWLKVPGTDGWPTIELETVRYLVHPRAMYHRARITVGDRLKSPYEVVFIGQPIELERRTNDGAAIARRAAAVYGAGGLDALMRFVAYLGGRFTCFVHDTDRLVVLPDSRASRSTFWCLSGARFALSSQARLVAQAVTNGSPPAPAARRSTASIPGSASPGASIQPLTANFLLDVDLLGRRAAPRRSDPWEEARQWTDPATARREYPEPLEGATPGDD